MLHKAWTFAIPSIAVFHIFGWFGFCWHDLKAFQNGSLPRHSLKVQALLQKQVKLVLPHI